MEHYFTAKSTTDEKKHSFKFYIEGKELTFMASNAVFSKNQIDFGSEELIRTFMAEHEDAEGELLDVGCGYGTIGITLAKFFPKLKVKMVDVNERAISLAKENAKINGVEDRVEVFLSDRYENVEGKFDYILTNPPIRAGKQVVLSIYEGAFDYLNMNGELYSVIQKKQGAPSSKKKMQEIFGNCYVASKNAGYYILVSEKED